VRTRVDLLFLQTEKSKSSQKGKNYCGVEKIQARPENRGGKSGSHPAEGQGDGQDRGRKTLLFRGKKVIDV